MPLRLSSTDPPVSAILDGERLVVGSDASCDLTLAHMTVSRRHALIRITGERQAVVEDLQSRNGTYVDSKRIQGSQKIQAGDSLIFGRVQAKLEWVSTGDSLVAAKVDQSSLPADRSQAPQTTFSQAGLSRFAYEELPRLLGALGSENPLELVQQVGVAIARVVPVLELTIRCEVDPHQSVWFRLEPSAPVEESAEILLADGALRLQARLFPKRQADFYRPILELGFRLCVLADEIPAMNQRSRSDLSATRSEPARPPWIGSKSVDPSMQKIYEDASRVAGSNLGVLILGESGTGKDVLARFIHQASKASGECLTTLNCAALSRDLLDSELFGIERGVATGVDARPGKFEQAHGGTLFLDEIGDMSLETQARLLRVLEEGVIYRVGGHRPRPAQVRILAATNKDLNAMCRQGTFRQDLLFRIAGWVVRMPRLHQRWRDISNLAAHFLAEVNLREGRRIVGLAESAVHALQAYSWPGNIRELKTEISRAAIFVPDGQPLTVGHLQDSISRPAETPVTLSQRLAEFERELIEKEVALCDGDVSAAARRLGIGRSTLYRRLGNSGVSSSSELDVADRRDLLIKKRGPQPSESSKTGAI